MASTAHHFPARLILGPALRAQSDRRLVDLVREGHESAFEEIVRRYRRPLDRFAASIVGAHADDVTQDSFRKALEALRTVEADVELRPWLFRIVRNTALNDLRDRPPAAAELAEDLVAGGRSAAVEAEQRAELQDLIAQLRALPENQRAALVMRELEGMSHEEIAAALGISDGAARQAIARARAAIRSGFGAVIPLPLLRALTSGGDRVAEATGGAAAGGGAIAAGAAGAGGISAGAALKVGLATVVVAGTLGAGVAIERQGGGQGSDSPPEIASAPHGADRAGTRTNPSSSPPMRIGPKDGSPGVAHHVRGAGEGPRHHDRHHAEPVGGDVSGSRIVPVTEQTTSVTPEPHGHREEGGGGPGPSRQAAGHGGTDGGGHQAAGGDGHQGVRNDASGDGAGSGDAGGSSGGGESGHESFDGGGNMSGSAGGGDGSGTSDDGAFEPPPTQTSGAEDGGSWSGGQDSGTSGGDGGGTESTAPIETQPQSPGETLPSPGTEPSP